MGGAHKHAYFGGLHSCTGPYSQSYLKMLVTVASVWAGTGQKSTCDNSGAGCPSCLVCRGVLGCAGRRMASEKAWVLPWSAGVAHCLSGTHRTGTLLGPEGKRVLAEGEG